MGRSFFTTVVQALAKRPGASLRLSLLRHTVADTHDVPVLVDDVVDQMQQFFFGVDALGECFEFGALSGIHAQRHSGGLEVGGTRREDEAVARRGLFQRTAVPHHHKRGKRKACVYLMSAARGLPSLGNCHNCSSSM